MDNVSLREPRDEDWADLLALANRSLSEMQSPPSQEEWVANRRSFSASEGVQKHFVAIIERRIVGYAGAEWRKTQPEGWYRVFVVWPRQHVQL
jgi:hypothetical protein